SVNSVSGETTLDIPVSVSATSALNFGGDGDLNILQPIGNGDVPVAVPGALSIFGFDIDNNNLALNLDQNGGMVNGVPPDPAAATNLNFLAEALLTDGPGGRGLDFDSDEDFQNAGVIPTNQFDRYSTLFIGYLNVHAAQAGDWQFQRLADDDQIGIWLDVNTNGIFESTPVGFGSNRDEQLQWDGDGGIKTRTLAEGRYLFAATHHEGTGGSQAHVVFKSPLMGSLANIKPGDANQAGMWEPLGAAAPGIQAANALNKSGAGVLRLFADNPFNQEVNITGGMIVAAHDQSLGTDTAIFASNGSLAFTNNVTIAGKTLNARGALEPVNLINLGDDNAFLGDILVSDFPSLGFSTTSPAGRLTVGTPGNHVLTLGPSKLTLDGPGEIVVNSDVSNTTGITGVNALRHYGYHFRNDGIALDLDQNGGMMGGGDPTTFQNFFGQAFLTTGPGGRGLDYDNDQDFQNEGVIATTQNDNYSDLVLGYLVVSPAEAGDWEFRRNVDDDNMGIWLDLNQNAIFESTTAGLDSDRGEQLQYDNDGGTKIVTLAAGAYLFAVTHAEGGGGSEVHVQFKAPSMPAQLTVNPGDPVQDGIWQLYFDSSDEVEKQGSGTATLTGNNTYVGPTTLLDGVLIAGSPAALGDTTDGTVANGGTLAIPSGATYSTAETLILNGTGAADMPGALVSLGGLTTINPPTVIVAHSNAMIAGIGSLADTFTVNPDIDLGYAALSASGEGDIILNGEVHGLGLGASQPPYPLEVLGDAPLLYYQLNETSGSNVVNSGTAGSTFDGMVFDGAHTDLNVPSLDTTLGTAAAFDDNIASGITTPFSMNVLSNQFTIEAWVMSPSPQNNRSGVAGQNDAYEFGMASGTEIELWSPAAAAFRTPYPSGEWFHLVATGDGSNRTIYVNGVAVATDADVVADYGNSGFFFNIGGQGIQDGPTVNNGNAFNGFIDEVALYDKALSPSDVERHYDARDALSAINAVVKTGGGTLTLAGANTYDGGTTASSGILMVSGSTATGTVAVREAVLMGTGTIGGGVAVQTRGETNPGASVGTLSVTGGLTYSNFSSVFHAELDSAASYDQLSVGGDITLSNATLNLIKAPGYTPTPTDVLVLAMGSSVSGTFNGIPQGQRISAQGAEFVVSYLGNAITLNATGGFLTYAGPDTIVRPTGVGVSVPASQLLANDQVGDGVGPLMITSVLASSIENGTVSFDGTTVTFTPAPGYEGADSFTYTVTDGTDAVLGLVSVITGEPPAGEAATAILGGTQQLPNGDYRIAFRGTPGASYDIEWTQDLTEQPISWQVLGSVVAAPDGSILLDHAAPAGTVNYYRATLR
ncbi:MAG: autotransporter-associated beta strand protein, partial [Candidatus Omnitrophota bacterium]